MLSFQTIDKISPYYLQPTILLLLPLPLPLPLPLTLLLCFCLTSLFSQTSLQGSPKLPQRTTFGNSWLVALPVTQPTVSKYYTDRIFLHTKLNEINCSYFWQQPCIIYALSRPFSRRETKCSSPWFRHRKLTRDFVASTTMCWW